MKRRHHGPIPSAPELLESRLMFTVTTTTLHPTADAYVRDGTYASQNFGQALTLDDKRHTAAGYTRQSYLTFDTSSVAGNTTSAIIRVYGGLGETATMPLQIFAVPTTSWGENSITFSNKPATSGGAIATQNVTQAKQWYQFDVTSYVAAQRAAGHKFVSFALISQYETNALASFNSDEASANRPEIVVTADDGTVPTGLPTITAATSTYGVVVGAGKVTLSNGSVINVTGGTLTLDPPHVGSHTYTGYAPPNWAGNDPTQRWPDSAANLHPNVDTLLLGGLYHGVIGSSVVVKNSSGKVFARDVDYKLNTEWGQVMNLNSRLGAYKSGSLSITYQSVDQRLDLIEVMPNGSLAVKKGTSAVTAPSLPVPDAGAVGIAGVLVYTLNGARTSGFVMEQRDIFPIKPVAPVQGVNVNTIPKTLNKLRTGGNVRIAYFGDSITEGAEAGSWWSDRSKTYTDLTTAGLRARFPSANISEFVASQGGKSLYDSQATFQTILDQQKAGNTIDCVVINLGMNDTGLSDTINSSKSALATYIDQARAAGMEVIVMTPIESNPYYNPSNRAPRSVVAAAIKDVAMSKNAALMDMYTEWVNQGTRGIAPFSQLHNTFNHPGVAGHRLIADALLRMFPAT